MLCHFLYSIGCQLIETLDFFQSRRRRKTSSAALLYEILPIVEAVLLYGRELLYVMVSLVSGIVAFAANLKSGESVASGCLQHRTIPPMLSTDSFELKLLVALTCSGTHSSDPSLRRLDSLVASAATRCGAPCLLFPTPQLLLPLRRLTKSMLAVSDSLSSIVPPLCLSDSPAVGLPAPLGALPAPRGHFLLPRQCRLVRTNQRQSTRFTPPAVKNRLLPHGVQLLVL